ncbi:hypothetical protein PYW08_013784 [Mythimna loreyi]|uniref:Uncharacterized protein n=1 Tax=Mythimna loreyi TaxID=667449 RepID=A0ACC2R5K8_9NEOP|nr:hypothetical protein PYW08_013784 [Mythimna loreyi]
MCKWCKNYTMRNYKKTTERGTKSVELMKRAADLVANEKISLRQVCRDYEISRTSLKRFMARLKEHPESQKFGYGTPRLVFNQEQETSLCEYLLTLAQIFHGVGPKDVRRLAYECAVKYNLKIPEIWHTNKMAGKDWLTYEICTILRCYLCFKMLPLSRSKRPKT